MTVSYRRQTIFFFKQKTAYEILSGLVGSEMCIRDSTRAVFGNDIFDGVGRDGNAA